MVLQIAAVVEALSHRKPASAGISYNSICAWRHDKRDTCIVHSLEQIKTKIRQSDIDTPLWTTGKIQRIISQKSLNYCDSL